MRVFNLLLLISMFIPFPLPAQVGERYIEVTGTSEIEVVPDRIHYVIEIREYFEEEFDGVSKPEEYRTKVPLTRIEEELKQVLKIVGVPREAIRTKDVGDNWRKPGQDFLVSKSFDVTLRDFTLIDEILKRVDTQGIHTMYIDKLEHRDILSYHRKGKIEALKAAREKAVYLLEAIGKRPGEIIRIVEGEDAGKEMFAQGHILSVAPPPFERSRTIKKRYSMLVRFGIVDR